MVMPVKTNETADIYIVRVLSYVSGRSLLGLYRQDVLW